MSGRVQRHVIMFFTQGNPVLQGQVELRPLFRIDLYGEAGQDSAMINRGFRFRLCPTAEQGDLFRQFAGVCRLVYNLALEQRRDWYRQYECNIGARLNYIAQARELTMLRAEFDWIAAVSQTCQQQTLRDLDKAYANFFKGIARYPTPRKKEMNDTFRFQGREVVIRPINARWCAVRLPKIGWVKFRNTRQVRGTIRNATVGLAADGWHISFSCEMEHAVPVNDKPSVGIDRGVVNAIAFSDGTPPVIAPAAFARIERQRRRAQKVLCRRKRGSKRYARQRKRVSALHARSGRIRRDWLHRVSTTIARSYGTVVMEDLKVKNMTASAKGTIEEPGRMVRQKAGLNRAILAQGWTSFASLLTYKLEERGGHLVTVNPAYTSQTCPACDAVDARSRKSQAVFECVTCGHRDNADSNAAINILRRNTASMDMEEGHRLSGEVSTTKAA